MLRDLILSMPLASNFLASSGSLLRGETLLRLSAISLLFQVCLCVKVSLSFSWSTTIGIGETGVTGAGTFSWGRGSATFESTSTGTWVGRCVKIWSAGGAGSTVGVCSTGVGSILGINSTTGT